MPRLLRSIFSTLFAIGQQRCGLWLSVCHLRYTVWWCCQEAWRPYKLLWSSRSWRTSGTGIASFFAFRCYAFESVRSIISLDCVVSNFSLAGCRRVFLYFSLRPSLLGRIAVLQHCMRLLIQIYRRGFCWPHGCTPAKTDAPIMSRFYVRDKSINQIKSNMTLMMVDKPQPGYNLLNVMK